MLIEPNRTKVDLLSGAPVFEIRRIKTVFVGPNFANK